MLFYKQMIRRIAVRAIITNKSGELLAVRLKSRDGSVHEYWSTIGGGVDSEEALIPALHREVIEETGKTPVIGQLLFVQQFKEVKKDKEHVEFFFHVTNGEDFTDIDLSKTTHGMEEIAHIGFIDPASSFIKPDFLSTVDFTQLGGKSTQFFNNL